MTVGMQSSFEKTATGENTCPPELRDNILYRGNLLTVSFAARGGQQAIVVEDGVDKLRPGYECQAVMAVYDLSKALENPEAARQDITEQVIKYGKAMGADPRAIDDALGYVDAGYVDFISNKAPSVPKEPMVSDQQKSQLFTALGKVPDVLKRAIDQDGVNIVVDNAEGLKGMAPKAFEGSAGLYHGGNIFIAEPYQASTIIDAAVHHANEKMDFVKSSGFSLSLDKTHTDHNMLQVIGFGMNKRYYQDEENADYLEKGVNNMAREFLSDMYQIRAGVGMQEPLDARSAKMLTIETAMPDKMTRLEGLEKFYNTVVRGKTAEQIEEFYEGREPKLFGIRRIPGTDIMSQDDKIGRELARAMNKIPEGKMDAIFNNKDNPEELMKVLYTPWAIEKLDEFSNKMEEQYPKPKELGAVEDPQLKNTLLT